MLDSILIDLGEVLLQLRQLDLLLRLADLIRKINPRDGNALVVALNRIRHGRLERNAVLGVVRGSDLLDLVLIVRADDAADLLVVDLLARERRLELRGVEVGRRRKEGDERILDRARELIRDRTA